MRKVAIYETSWLRNVQYEARQLLEAMESINVDRDVEELMQGEELGIAELGYREEAEANREGQRREESVGLVDQLRRLAGKWVRGEEEERAFLQQHLSAAFSSSATSLDSHYSFHSLLKSSSSRHYYTSLLLSQCPNRLPDPALDQLAGQIHVLVHESMRAREGNIVLEIVALAGRVEAKGGPLIERMKGWREWREEWLWQVAASIYPPSYLQTTMEILGLDSILIKTTVSSHSRKPSTTGSYFSKDPIATKKVPKWTEALNFHTKPLLSSPSLPSLQTEVEDLEPELSTEVLSQLPFPSKSGDLTLSPPPTHLT